MLYIIIAVACLAYVAVTVSRMLRYVKVARRAIRLTKPYGRHVDNATQHVLVIGDSTMYSAGVTRPQNTMGGLLAAKFPEATIETLAFNGARAADLPDQLAHAAYSHYDFVLLGIGGNDVVRFSSYGDVRRQLRDFLASLENQADKIIMCNSVNVGNIGFFLFPLNYLFDRRSRQLGQLCTEITKSLIKVTFVDLYRPMNNDHYDKASRPKFIAADGFHANDYANRYFFEYIWDRTQQL